MSNPFKVGDKCYHPQHGECAATEIDGPEVRLDTFRANTSKVWVDYRTLSFEPWPAPAHTKPIKEGWWVVKFCKDKELLLRQFKGGDVFDAAGNKLLSPKMNKYTFIHHLDELKE